MSVLEKRVWGGRRGDACIKWMKNGKNEKEERERGRKERQRKKIEIQGPVNPTGGGAGLREIRGQTEREREGEREEGLWRWKPEEDGRE